MHYKSAIFSSLIEVSSVHPLDVYKTLYQQNNTYRFSNFLKTGMRFKYKGYTSRLIGIIPMRTTFWLSQDYAETNFNCRGAKKYLSIGLFSSLCQTIIDTPVENIKIRKISNIKPLYNKLYTGFSPNFFRNYIFVTNVYLFNKKGDEYGINKFVTGSLGGMVGAIVSHPIDYIKTNRQAFNFISYLDLIKDPFHFKNCMNGCVVRASMSFISMGIGSLSYYYMKNL